MAGSRAWLRRIRAAKAYAARQKAILDPAKLIVVDEADRLQMASLEQLRAIFDESDLGLILIGIPGLEKRLVGLADGGVAENCHWSLE